MKCTDCSHVLTESSQSDNSKILGNILNISYTWSFYINYYWYEKIFHKQSYKNLKQSCLALSHVLGWALQVPMVTLGNASNAMILNNAIVFQ